MAGLRVFWNSSFRRLSQRGLRGVVLVISDAHTGLKTAIARPSPGQPGSGAGSTSCGICLLESRQATPRWWLQPFALLSLTRPTSHLRQLRLVADILREKNDTLPSPTSS